MSIPAPTDTQRIQQACSSVSTAGYKLTAPRLAVLTAIHSFDGVFSAADVADVLTQHGTPLGDASLFRTLKLYTDIGVLQRIHGTVDCHRYMVSTHQHAHRVICTQCGRVREFAECGLDVLISTLEQQTGYRIAAHILELFGICDSCRTRSEGTFYAL